MNNNSRILCNNYLTPVATLFESLLDGMPIERKDSYYPSLDVYQDDKTIFVEADMPGFKEENIEITVEDGIMVIKAQNEEVTENGSKSYIQKERTNRAFFRRFTLPSNVDDSKVDATLTSGVLKVSIPKIAPPEPKKITINKK